MNWRNGGLFCAGVAVVAGITMSSGVSSVEAGSLSGPVVPQRFFNLIASPRAGGSALLQAAADDKKAPGPPAGLPEGKGKDVTQKDCTMCHATNTFTTKRHTRDEWRSIVDDMVSKGLDAPDSDLDIIADYLAANFGPPKTPQPASPDAAAPPPQ